LSGNKSLQSPFRVQALIQLLEAPYKLEPPINRPKRAEVQDVINNPNPKKPSDYILITGKILKELPLIEIQYLTPLFRGHAVA
jgi:hypothetical protein